MLTAWGRRPRHLHLVDPAGPDHPLLSPVRECQEVPLKQRRIQECRQAPAQREYPALVAQLPVARRDPDLHGSCDLFGAGNRTTDLA